MKPLCLFLAAAAAIASAGSLAHGSDPSTPSKHHAASNDGTTAFGRPGDGARATHTVEIAMSDAMRFTPDSVTVKKGETVRFIVRNQGRLLHEMVLGSDEDLRRHAGLMRASPAMEHAEPYVVHVNPGEQGQMVWTFDRPGRFSFACLIPGHFEAGMKGAVVVK